MTRQVQAEAVFNTANAVQSLANYTQAINGAIAAHSRLNAVIGTAQLSLTRLNTAFGISQTHMAGQAQALASVARIYTSITQSAMAAANAINQAGRARGPTGPGGGGPGGPGNHGGGNRNYAGGWHQPRYYGGMPSMPGIPIPGGIPAALGLFGAGYITKELIEVADKWTDITGRIRVAHKAGEDFVKTQETLFEIAQKTRTSYETIADSFSRIMTAGRGIGLTTDQAAVLTEVIADAGRAAHRSSSEILSFSTQFPQALAEGRVRGEEFRSMLKSYPLLLDVIGEKLGKTRGELNRSSREGQLLIEGVINALMQSQGKIAALAAEAPRTISQAWTQLQNTWLKVVGQIANSEGFVDSLTRSIDRLIKTIQSPIGELMIQKALTAVSSAIDYLTLAVSNGTFLETLTKIVGMLEMFRAGMFAFVREAANVSILDPLKPLRAMGDAMNQVVADTQKALEKQARLREDEKQSLWEFHGALNNMRGATIAKADPFKATQLPPDPKAEAAQKAIKEKLEAAEQQLLMQRFRNEGNWEAADRAEVELAVAKAITADMRERVPLEAARLEYMIRQTAEEKIQERHRNERKGTREKIAALDEEINLARLSLGLDERAVHEARTQLAIEKAITADMRARQPDLAAELEARIRIRSELERTAKKTQEWQSLYENMGNTLVDSMMSAGREGKKFTDGLKDAGKQMLEMVLRAVILKPLMESISKAMAGATFGASGQGPGDFAASIIPKVLGAAFGAGVGDVGLGSWAPTISSAKGNAFAGGHLTSFAKGGTVNNRQLFRHAGGMGEMGEMGTEGILPLFRGRDGALGVKAAGAGGGATSIHMPITITGDATEATIARLRSEMAAMAQRIQGAAAKTAVALTKRELVSDPKYLKR